MSNSAINLTQPDRDAERRGRITGDLTALAAVDRSQASVTKPSLEAFVTLVENYQATDRFTAAGQAH